MRALQARAAGFQRAEANPYLAVAAPAEAAVVNPRGTSTVITTMAIYGETCHTQILKCAI
jgi:hypothetical protein